MKYRYLKIAGDLIWGKDNISKADLIQVAQGGYDTVIDTENGTYFDSENNAWKDIEGDER